MMKFLSGTVFGALTFLGGVLIGQAFFIFPAINNAAQTAPIAGAFNTTGGGTYNLQATITSSQNTIQLSSFLEPQSNIPYTMSYLNSSIEYATIAPQTSQSEFISFTGITQNNDGSATLTGVQRGLDRSYPYTASTTLTLPHAGQSRLILSNPPQVYNSYGALANPNTWVAVNTFGSTTPPAYDFDPVWANFSTQIFADVSYVNSVVAAGAANGSETVKGIYQLATAAQAALSTSLGSTGARLALGANLATSTPGLSTVTGDIPTLTGSFLNQAFINLTQAFTFSTTTQYFANIGTLTATTSARLPANTTAGGLPILTTSYVPIKYTLINTTTFNTSNGTGNGTTFGTSTDSLTIPAGVFAASSTIAIFAANNDNEFCNIGGGGTATCTLLLRDSLGDTLASVSTSGNGNSKGTVNINIFNQNNTSSQKYITSLIPLPITAVQYVSTTGSAAVNTSGTITLFLVAQISNSGVGASTVFDLNNFSIVVTP